MISKYQYLALWRLRSSWGGARKQWCNASDQYWRADASPGCTRQPYPLFRPFSSEPSCPAWPNPIPSNSFDPIDWTSAVTVLLRFWRLKAAWDRGSAPSGYRARHPLRWPVQVGVLFGFRGWSAGRGRGEAQILWQRSSSRQRGVAAWPGRSARPGHGVAIVPPY